MAVYTDVPPDALERFVGLYDIGDLRSCKGIAEGTENSNFLLTTDRGRFILTLYERRVREQDLPFFLGLMEHLAAQGIACPTPVHARDGRTLASLESRPAAIVTFLDGLAVQSPRAVHCEALGCALAQLHAAGHSFERYRANALGVRELAPLVATCLPDADRIAGGLALELKTTLETLTKAWPSHLPSGVIHADLFPDNVFFIHDKLSGLIDFYFACNDFWAYDLAICLNAWCFDTNGQLDQQKARVLLHSYQQVRALTRPERMAFGVLAQGAALRFLLTRLYDWLRPANGALVERKDPLEYLRILRFHRNIKSTSEYGLG